MEDVFTDEKNQATGWIVLIVQVSYVFRNSLARLHIGKATHFVNEGRDLIADFSSFLGEN